MRTLYCLCLYFLISSTLRLLVLVIYIELNTYVKYLSSMLSLHWKDENTFFAKYSNMKQMLFMTYAEISAEQQLRYSDRLK